MRLQRKLFAFIVLIVVVTASTCFASYASGISGTENKKTDETELVQISPDTYIEELEQALPEEIRELMPQDENGEDVAQSVVEPSYLITISGKLLSMSLSGILRHFICYGMREGRRASRSFDVYAYCDCNPDVEQLYGGDLRDVYLHYIELEK